MRGMAKAPTVSVLFDSKRLKTNPLMKRLFLYTWLTVSVCVLTAAQAQTFNVTRSKGAYNSQKPLTPAGIIDPNRFAETAARRYVVVEGYINFLSGSVSSKTGLADFKIQDDGDFHFEMQGTRHRRGGGTSPNGLTCEVVPVLWLKNSEALRQVDKNDPKTYRKVRLYGFLRFGTEGSGHSGIRIYNLGNGKTIKGHWEIHPVERIEAIDRGSPLKVGPSAGYKAWPISRRYKLTKANFQKASGTNHGHLAGIVKSIKRSSNKSGDVDVILGVNENSYIATIPQYYVKSFNAKTQTVKFVKSPNFSAINYSLKPDKNTPRTFYGLRDWKFQKNLAFSTMQPVEMIK